MNYTVFKMIVSHNGLVNSKQLVVDITGTTFVKYIELVEKVESWARPAGLTWHQALISPAEAAELRFWSGNVDLDFGGQAVPKSAMDFFHYVLEAFNAKAGLVLEFLGEVIVTQLADQPQRDGAEVYQMMVGIGRLIHILMDLLAVRIGQHDGNLVVDNHPARRSPWFPINSLDDIKELRLRFG